MPTRKELLELLGENVEGLSDEMSGYADAHRDAAEAIYQAAERNRDAADNFSSASDVIATSAKNLGGDLIAATAVLAGGLIGAAVVNLYGNMIGDVVPILFERAMEVRRKTQMIESILALQERNKRLTYDLVLERAFAQSSDMEMRRTILNELIFEDIAEQNKGDFIYIDPEGEALNDYWTWLAEIRDILTSKNP